MSSNILHKFWCFTSIVFVLTLVYLIVNDWSYNTLFLPFLEGYLTITGLLAYGYIYTALQATKAKEYSLKPWLITFIFILIGILIAIFNADVLVRSTALLVGGLGIPLGIIIQIVHSALNPLPTLVQTLVLITPSLGLLVHFFATGKHKPFTSSPAHFLTNLVMPLFLLVISAMFVALYIGAQELSQTKDDTSYQQGRELQEVIEGYYREKGYFPESLTTLVEEKYLSELPVSVIDEAPFTYEVDTGLQNYTVCFPRHGQEVCERSWSR